MFTSPFRNLGLLLLPCLFSVAALAQTAQPTPGVLLKPSDCSWEAPAGTSPRARRAMKTRTDAAGKGYKEYDGGKAIDIAEWFRFTCGLDSFITATPEDKPIIGAEDMAVTIIGYVVGVKFMREGDHDLHVKLAASPDWNGDHMVVEMSPGAEYCEARAALWKIAEKDGCKSDECILNKPVKVKVRGYMLIGAVPQGTTDYCHAISARGLKDKNHEGRVRGIWRLQPVLSLKKVS